MAPNPFSDDISLVNGVCGFPPSALTDSIDADEEVVEGQSGSHWEVLVDCPLKQDVYIYWAPTDFKVQAGDMLGVPFGSQQVSGIALRLVTQLPAGLNSDRVRQITEVIGRGFFPILYWQLLERVAHHYQTPLIRVLRTALPPGLLGRTQRRIRLGSFSQTHHQPSIQKKTNHPEVSIDGQGYPSNTNLTLEADLSTPAQQILALLRSSPSGEYSWRYLQGKVNNGGLGLKQLLQKGWVESFLRPQPQMKPKVKSMVSLAPAPVDPPHLSDRQKEVLEVLKRQGGELEQTQLLQRCHVSATVLKALIQKGYLHLHQQEVFRGEPYPVPIADVPPSLTAQQADALSVIESIEGYGVVLLHGVTGSGKTEIYLRAIATQLNRHRSVIVLVPEIGLTPQLTDRFRARFVHQGVSILLYHSGLSDGERYDAWRQMLNPVGINGGGVIVIGTRSAVFAPLPNLGLIILDEEHDDSFKQDQPTPCYHARTVANWRASLVNCPLILGSATPSLETWLSHTQALTLGRHYLPLPHRIHSRPLPPIEVVDMRQELRQGNRSLFSRRLQTALANLLTTHQQGILFIPRRGHSTCVLCRDCGSALDCPHCDVSLSYHQPHTHSTPVLRCHYCNYGQLQPSRCPSCGSPNLKHFGAGTQRVVEEVKQLFPELRTLRFDSDTTRTKGSHRSLLTRFAHGEVDLLIGTQMITKGIDLPQVTLVAIVAADGLLHQGDFRSSERAYQTLIQVAGRAGRGHEPGRVILQTYNPGHSVIQAVEQYDYENFGQQELQCRSALNYPPYGHLVLLRFGGMDDGLVKEVAEKAAHILHSTADALPYGVLGPAPAFVHRVARVYRWHVLLKVAIDGGTGTMVDFPWNELRAIRDGCPAQVHLTIDVDPLHLG